MTIEPEQLIIRERDFGSHQAIIDEIHRRWKDQPLMEGCEPRHAKQLAVILENQTLVSQSFDLYKHPIHKVSVEIVSKIFKNHPIFDMVSVQPLLGPVGSVFYLRFRYTSKKPKSSDYGDLLGMMNPDIESDANDLPEISLVMESEDVTARTKKMKTCWSYEEDQKDKIIAILSSEIRDEIFREVSSDLRGNAGTLMNKELDFTMSDKDVLESIYVNIVEMSGVIHRKTLRGGTNWLLTGPDLAKRLARGYFLDLEDDVKEIKKVGTLNARWKLFVDPLFPPNQILCGYKGDSILDSGYFFSPYIPLTESAVILDPEFCARPGYLTRHGKKLLREGAKFFGLIKYGKPEVKKDNGSYVI